MPHPAAIIAIFTALSACGLRAADAPPAVVAIQPLGEVPAARADVVRNGLAEAFGREVAVLPARPLPAAAWHARAHAIARIGC